MKRGFFALLVCGFFTSCGDDPGGAGSSSSDSGAGDASMSGASASNASASNSGASNSSAEEESGSMMEGCESGPLADPIPGCTPTPLTLSGDFGQDCVDRINQFRWECQCLPPLQRWADAEMCTDEQSMNDHDSQVPHGNFQACNEWAQNTCPDWPSEEQIINGCLQAMWDEGPGEPFEEHGHYINMSNTDYVKVACGRFDSGQGIWSNQNFSN